MFPNLDAEQARHGKTNADMAVLLKLSGTTSYENKKKNGNFSVSDAIRMCDLFDCDYEDCYYDWVKDFPYAKCPARILGKLTPTSDIIAKNWRAACWRNAFRRNDND